MELPDLKMPISGHGIHMDMPGMKMYFHIGFNDYILFKQYLPSADWEMALTCLLIFLIAVGYEGFKVCRQRHLESSVPNDPQEPESYVRRRFRKAHIIQSVLHILQVAFGYILMLLAMTYNVWIFLAVILGAGFGYFLFSANNRQHSAIVEEHCN